MKHPPEKLNGAARFRPQWVPWLWVTVPALIVIVLNMWPFVQTIITSFTDTAPLEDIGDFVGLENYRTVFSDEEFWQAVINSLIYAVVVVPLMIFLPLLLALLVREHVPGIGFFRAVFYIPAVTSLVAITLSWRFLLNPSGPINNLLGALGLEPLPFLSSSGWILACSIVITLWNGMPYNMILYLTALVNVDQSLYEAAELDGASSVRRFFTVTVPGVKVMMYLVGVLTTINCLKVFAEPYLLGGTNSPVTTITMYIRDLINDPTFGSLGEGTAASVFLFCLTLVFILLSQKLQNKAEE